MFRYLPEQASDFAPLVDSIHNWLTDISVFFTVAIVGAMIYFAIKYRRKNGVDHETPQIEGNNLLEFIWTFVPSVICVVVAAYGYYGFKKIREVPTDEPVVEVNVTGKQWTWLFQYPNGKQTSNEFTVPVNKPVRLIMTSTDVLHSFFVPDMRTKMDVIPGRYSMEWFRPVKTGTYQVYCTEFCGTQHSAMLAKLHVVAEAEYDRWLNQKERAKSPAELGREIYSGVGACSSCHTLDGSNLVGPTFLNLHMKKGKFDDGKEYTADDEYLRGAILNSQTDIVAGFPKPSPMPVFKDQLNNEQIGHLIAFIKTVKGEAPKVAAAPKVDLASLTPQERGKLLYTSKACVGCHSLDGSSVVGPTFKGVFGKSEQFDDGSTGSVDEAYLKTSILNPQEKIVKGFPRPSPMPAFAGQLKDEEIADLIEFIKTIK